MYRYLIAVTLLALTACSESQAPFESSSITDSPISETRGSTLVGRIAFSGYRNGELGDIYVMNPDGTGTTQLTSTADDDRSPSWSYDNQRIAFMRPRPDAANVPHYDVYVIDATGSNGHWVLPTPTSEDLLDPTWSPDGSRLVVWTVDYKVGLIDVATGAITFLQHDQDDFLGENPSFDPTGQKIVSGFGPKLRIINADGTGTPLVIPTSSGTQAQAPAFSPDGQRIIFSLYNPSTGQHDLYSVGANGAGLSRLSGRGGADTRPTWSADGKQIAYGYYHSGAFEVWRTTPSGGKRVKLSSGAGIDITPAYSH